MYSILDDNQVFKLQDEPFLDVAKVTKVENLEGSMPMTFDC